MDQQYNQYQPPSQPQSIQNKQEKSVGKMVLAISGIIFFILLVGGVSYLLGAKAKGRQEVLSPTPTLYQPQIQNPPPTFAPTPTLAITAMPSVSTTPSPTPPANSKIISSDATLDGFRSSNSGGNVNLEIRAGRNSTLVTRGFVSFSMDSLPSGAKIESATLRLYQAKVLGNPYVAGGALKIDHMTYGDSLDSADYAAPALTSSFATVSNNATIEWKEVDVTDEVKDDLANARSTSQYRIHFTNETTGGNVTGDFAYFEAAENSQSTGNTPQLVLKYN